MSAFAWDDRLIFAIRADVLVGAYPSCQESVMHNLVMGANAPLPMDRFDILIEWPAASGTLDPSTYLIGPDGKVRSDADMIFYNQLEDAAGCVRITASGAGSTRLAFDMTRAPDDVDRIVMCVTIEDSGLTMEAFRGTAVTMIVDGTPVMSFRPDLSGAREVAMRLAAVYRRSGTWKLRADGQGFNSGLARLAKSFGIDVEEDERPPVRDPAAAGPSPLAMPAQSREVELVRDATGSRSSRASSSMPVPPPPPLPPPPPRRDDGSTKLSVEHPAVQWEGSVGEIAVKLGWDSQCGGLHGRPRVLDPELGCFYRLEDGRRGLVQAWDGSGQFDTAPFVHLMHAEVEGTRGDKRLRINGSRWSAVSEMTLFAYLRADAPNWRTASMSLTVSADGRKPVSLALEGGPDGSGAVALVTLTNREDGVDIRRLARFAPGHQELDEYLGWDLRWKTRYD